MTSKDIRSAFLNFFSSKQHKIVPSAPMVIKNDPTLMFTNAGMNQFKDYFLGNKEPEAGRVADTQKCLRVAGKHNDLEEVGHDTYHHTMFEMLGNWSFGDYFKKDAIGWAWEFLTDIVKIDPERLYVTIFEGDKVDNVSRDDESYNFWKEFIPKEKILEGNKKDNFWEMGNTGPCGPCSEIHIDLRSDDERSKKNGVELVNKDHPQVIEVWNLVFIQYNRKADSSLENLPHKHVDTGMGFERLCMALQGKTSNYDTDVFSPIIDKIASLSGYSYGEDPKLDIAMRVIADHLRAIAFSIADGQLPSNNKAGYVIRRILRRAVRYAYTYLNQNEPFIHQLVPVLVNSMGEAFEELSSQQQLISKVIFEEEQSFLKTLENGIKRLGQMVSLLKKHNEDTLEGRLAFELYDTYGFPLDLTELILKESKLNVDAVGFSKEMDAQKMRSKNAAVLDKDDWVVLLADDKEEFTGYDFSTNEVRITRYRKVTSKDKALYQLVFNLTPFYAESGGQVGDKGWIRNDNEKVDIIDTQKENDLIIHMAKKLPDDPEAAFAAHVNESERTETANHHSATHLLHHALREVLGTHVEQKGSLVHPGGLRFDFAHFQKMSDEEIGQVEQKVNAMIRRNITLEEMRQIPMTEAEKMGAIALFGEKYTDMVRVIKFGESIELCGGIHVKGTGQIGFFKISRESAIAAGIRRIEAVAGQEAEKFIYNLTDMFKQVSDNLEKHADIVEGVKKMISENTVLSKEVETFKREAMKNAMKRFKEKAEKIGDINFIGQVVPVGDADLLRDAAFKLKGEVENLFLVLGGALGNKALLVIMISDNLVSEKGLNASNIIREVAKEIQGGGGGQPFFATAGGKKADGLPAAINKAREILKSS